MFIFLSLTTVKQNISLSGSSANVKTLYRSDTYIFENLIHSNTLEFYRISSLDFDSY